LSEISPFQGVRYNQEKVPDLASVICPPYDVISPEEQQEYHRKSEYNVIQLEYGMVLQGDDKNNNKYTRARAIFDKWLKDHILQVDTAPTFYIYEQGFTINDAKKKRLGLITCVKLEPWERKVIFPHENTFQRVKNDRLELMRACNANISPILGLYEDPGGKVTKLMQAKSLPSKLLIDITIGNETHHVWKANEPEFMQRCGHFIFPKPIYIADGHHRYETALAYRDERWQKSAANTGYEAFNFAMMTLVPFSDPGLVMLPIHRLIRNVEPEKIKYMKEQLSKYFDIKFSPLNNAELSESRSTGIKLIGLEPDQIIILRPLTSTSLNDFMPGERSSIYKRLDVSIVEHAIIENLLGLQNDSSNITYTPDTAQAVKLVQDGHYQLAFILNPMSVTTIKAIADAGDRMPRKSTYFYPKLPTGLVINRLDGKL
jgi:uncharacterized protein (DUF1015 family)